MNRKVLLPLLVALVVLGTLASALVSYIRDQAVIALSVSEFKNRVSTELVLVTDVIRNDLLLGNIRGARVTLAKLREKGLFDAYQVMNEGVVVDETPNFSSLESLADDQYIRSVVPVFFSANGSEWGEVLYLTSLKPITELGSKLNWSLAAGSIVVSFILFLALWAIAIVIWKSTSQLSSIVVAHFSEDMPSHPSQMTAVIWGPLIQFSREAAIRVRRLNARLQEAEKDSALAQLAEQVAHDIRSPLSAIKMACHSSDILTLERREVISSAASRINGIANDLLSKSRKSRADGIETENSIRSQLDGAVVCRVLSEIVNEKRVQYLCCDRIVIETDFQSSFSTKVEVSKAELSRIVSNLLNNSIEAIDVKGAVRVSCREFQSDVSIVISDNGRGIPEEILKRLGTRGVSSRMNSEDSGNGLGVYHAKTVVESYGGKLTIQSKVGIGTIVTLLLPKQISAG